MPIDGPVNVLSVSMADIQNEAIPSSTAKKNHNAICYHQHQLCETVAVSIIHITKVDMKENFADMYMIFLTAIL